MKKHLFKKIYYISVRTARVCGIILSLQKVSVTEAPLGSSTTDGHSQEDGVYLYPQI